MSPACVGVTAEPLFGCRSLTPCRLSPAAQGSSCPYGPAFSLVACAPTSFIYPLWNQTLSTGVLPSSLQRHRWGQNAHCGQEPGPGQWVFTSARALAPKTLSCLGSPCHPVLWAAQDEGRRGTRKGGDPANAHPPAFPASGSMNPVNRPPGCALQTPLDVPWRP